MKSQGMNLVTSLVSTRAKIRAGHCRTQSEKHRWTAFAAICRLPNNNSTVQGECCLWSEQLFQCICVCCSSLRQSNDVLSNSLLWSFVVLNMNSIKRAPKRVYSELPVWIVEDHNDVSNVNVTVN